MNNIIEEIIKERKYQDKKCCGTWRHILEEEVAEAFAEAAHKKLRKELIQVAAVAVAWIEDLDRKIME